MTITFESVEPAAAWAEHLGVDLLATWVAVINAGGSVGFTAPAPEDAVARTLDRALGRVASGTDALGILRTEDAVVGMGILVGQDSDVCRHWRTVLRVMVHPDHQGQGAGVTLMHGLHRLGRQLGLEQLQLTVRAGQRLEGFYERLGYIVVGCHPGAVRVAPGEDRDEIMLVCSLG